jgi:hypothetical protein
MKKYIVFAAALLLGCLAIPVVEPVKAGSGCHGKKTKAAPVAVEVDQEVVVGPGVTVKESVEVDGPGNVTVTESVTVGEPAGAGGPPMGRRASHQAGRKVKRAMIAESKAERKAAKAAVKEADASQKAAAEAATAKAFFN